LAEHFGELFNGAFVALVPSPVAFLLRFDQAGFLQDAHVVRDGGLREVNAALDIAGAKAGILADRTGATNFQNLQDTATGGIGDGVQQTAKGLVLGGHAVEIDGKLMAVNVGKTGFQILDFGFQILNNSKLQIWRSIFNLKSKI
jgi:hypothetical protein